ncbi:MAG: CDP-glycerol glycerophosphotransferase family protein [Actinomycetales bacterium]|nr:CDP-glycerol glycerophosphotransferase family protein [Actinomycetales bacterium]
MPLFSVVVPAYGVQAFIREAIESVLNQDFVDFEVIAVDDKSPDRSGDIIDELAERDPRVTALHLPVNVGLGGARNAGMDAARGDYLIFLDGDDTLTPGSLSSIADRLAAQHLPDLCLYNYARTWWDGRVAVSSGDELLASLSVGTFAPRDHYRTFNLLPIACNKAYRRAFVNSLEARFGEGFYEDIPFTYRLLLQAKSAVALNQVVLDYRQRHAGSILRTPSPRHFDVFMQYDRVFEEFERANAPTGLRRHVYDIMINHFVTIVRRPDRVAASDRRRFFEQAAQTARRHQQQAPGSNRASAIRGRLLRDHSYTVFAAYDRSDRMRTRARRLAGMAYWPTRRTVRRVRSAGRLLYRLARAAPIDQGLVVFSEYWGTGFGCNPRAIFERLPEVAPELKAVWIISKERAALLPPGTPWVAPQSLRQWIVFARGHYFVNNVNFPGGYVKRPGQVHLQTMHGTPLKLCGLDVLSSAVASGAVDPMRQPSRSGGRVVTPGRTQVVREFADLLRRSDRWDFAVSSNAYSTEMWSHAYPCSYQWLEMGYPRNDALVNATAADVFSARERLGIVPSAVAMLYAPTFREAPGDVSLRIGLRRVLDRLPPEVVLIVRAHHTVASSKEMSELIDEGRIVDGSGPSSIVPCYLAADALITDYSSVMFDYALLDRPIVIYADDWRTYRQTRGTYFDLLEQPPGHVAVNEDQLVSLIVTGAYRSAESTRLRAQFRARFCTLDDGRAAESIIRRVLVPD